MSDQITIKLTKEESETLRYVLDHIGGCPVKSPRKHTESLSNKLDALGVAAVYLRAEPHCISFSDTVKTCPCCKQEVAP